MSEGTQSCGRPAVKRRADHDEHSPSRKYFRVVVEVLSWGSHIESYRAESYTAFPTARERLQGRVLLWKSHFYKEAAASLPLLMSGSTSYPGRLVLGC